MADTLRQSMSLIPAEVRMISGCEDAQTSADVSNVTSFQLPDPAGKSGGACTSTLLKILYADGNARKDLSFQDLLMEMRTILSSRKFTQIPQLSSSRPLDVKSQFEIVPEDCTGTRRAVLIGINYVGMQGELSGCHNDVHNIKGYIMDVWGFKEENITVLMDDGKHISPTRANILGAYKQLVRDSQPGDAAFCHYSGHGGKLPDQNGDEDDGFDETLIPLDYAKTGQIRDDDIYSILVGRMKSGVTLTCLMDCCHSGTVMDLPFMFKADGEQQEMEAQQGYNFQSLTQQASQFQTTDESDLSLAGIIEMITKWVMGFIESFSQQESKKDN